MILKTVSIGALALTAGMPKIGVSLTGGDRTTLLGQAAQVLTSATQIVEWRLDRYMELDNLAELINTATQLKRMLGTIPIMATFKLPTAAKPIDKAAYYQVYLTLVNNRAVAAVDIDVTMINDAAFMTLTTRMRANQIKLILSQTLDANTTQAAELGAYQTLAAAGADVARLMVDGPNANTVLTLMAATAQAHQTVPVPLIATVTGPLGRYNSVCGQLIGSAIVFGRVGRVGGAMDLPVSQLKQAVQTLSMVESGVHG